MNIKAEEIQRWRVEIENAEEFRRKHFGSYSEHTLEGAGENIEYYEKGDIASGTTTQGIPQQPYTATLNLVYTIARTIVPSLYYRNPKILAFPKRKQDEDPAPIAASLLNYYFNELNIKETNQLVILDAFLLGMGISKIGYATQFGMDIPDENEEKKRKKGKVDKLLEGLRLKKPKEEEKKENVELEENVIAENPYVVYVNPFDFGIDPRATSIKNAQFVYHKLIKTLKEVKANKNFKNTSKLEGNEVPENIVKDIPETEIENFKTIDLYEIHYKTQEGINILILAKNGKNYEYLYHDKSIYEMDGFQFEILTFNKHGHKLYPRSDVDIIKPLQDRLTSSFDNILDQVDMFQEKLFVDENGLTDDGKQALVNGELGAVVKCNKNPNEVFKESKFTQVKADLINLINQIVDMIVLEAGLTRAQLTGLSTAETATEAQIGQGGANIRLFARADAVQDYSNKQSRKLWQVIRQFVDLEEVELITGEAAVGEQGIPRLTWLNEIDSEMSDRLAKAELNFRIEVGSTQKPDLSVLRTQLEKIVNILGRTDVVALLQQQGKFLDVGELAMTIFKLYPDAIANPGKLIRPVNMASGQLTPEQMQAQLAGLKPGGGPGQAGNLAALQNAPVPTPTSQQEEVGGAAGAI